MALLSMVSIYRFQLLMANLFPNLPSLHPFMANQVSTDPRRPSSDLLLQTPLNLLDLRLPHRLPRLAIRSDRTLLALLGFNISESILSPRSRTPRLALLPAQT